MTGSFENCNLCGVKISSLRTRAAGENFFCAECHDDIVYPFVNMAVTQLVEAISGNKDAQQDFAESLAPGSKSKLVLGIARIADVGGTATGRFSNQDSHEAAVPSQDDSNSVSQSEDRVNEGESKETARQDRWTLDENEI